MITLLQQNQTAHPLLFLLVSSVDHTTPVTGAAPTVKLSKNGGAGAAPAGAVSEIDSANLPGWYAVAANATDANTLGPLILHASATGADPADVSFGVVAFNPDLAKMPATLDPADVAGTPVGVVSGTPSANSFQATGALSSVAGAYANAYLRFEAGTANAGLALPITSYSGATRAFGFSTNWPVTPLAGDAFVILGSHD